MGIGGLPPNVSYYIVFQTSPQSDKTTQSYPSANAGYRNGALIVARENVL
jgi:hypothetical protein